MTVFSWPHGHSGEFRDDLLTAEPEFASTEIGPEDEFLLMACDGLWDVLGKDEAVEHAKKFFDEVTFVIFVFAAVLLMYCRSRQSSNNFSKYSPNEVEFSRQA